MKPRLRHDLLGILLSVASLSSVVLVSIGILCIEGDAARMWLVTALWVIGVPLDFVARWANRRRCEQMIANERRALTEALRRCGVAELPISLQDTHADSLQYGSAQRYLGQ